MCAPPSVTRQQRGSAERPIQAAPYPKVSVRVAVDTTGRERVGFRTKGKLKTDIPGCVQKKCLDGPRDAAESVDAD